MFRHLQSLSELNRELLEDSIVVNLSKCSAYPRMKQMSYLPSHCSLVKEPFTWLALAFLLAAATSSSQITIVRVVASAFCGTRQHTPRHQQMQAPARES